MTPEEVKELIALKGWNQTDLARELGVDRAAVSMWVNGVRKPGSSSAKWMRRLLEDARGQQLTPVS